MKHILILFTDQQRRDTIAALGNPAIQTPNLDALAKDAVVFENCITPSPVCAPARLSMLAGRYPARTGCNNNHSGVLYSGEGFYSTLTAHGYQSCCVGKMHHPIDPYGPMGFEKRFTQEELASPEDDFTRHIHEKYPSVFDYHGMRSEMYYVPQISPFPPEDHPTQWVGDRSVEYIRDCDPKRPMLLMSSFIHPHPPFCPPAPWNKLYRDDPPTPFCPPSEDLEAYWELIGDRCSCKRLMMSEQDVLRMKNYYYACISFVDYQVGRIVKALKDKGMYDDTLILFSSDHGDMMGDYHATGKRTMVDASCHIPFLMRCPNVAPQSRADVCSLVDVAPTLLGFAGIPYDQNEFDGIDLFGGQHHDCVFSQYDCGSDGVYMVADGRSKLIYRAKTGRYFLFNSIPDSRDEYDPQNPAAQRLKTRLDDYRRSDAGSSAGAATYDPCTKRHPHYVGRVDQKLFHDEEGAMIPEGYHIDLA